MWHIMKHLSTFGLRDFIVAAGYKGDIIKDYFLNYESRTNDFTICLGDKYSLSVHGHHDEENWTVTVVDTGLDTSTGGRLQRLTSFLDQGPTLVTYGDGLADVNLRSLVERHRQEKLLATITLARPFSRFGVVELNSDDHVASFREKPQLESWVNMGYFIFERAAFDYLTDQDPLEDAPLKNLARDGQLAAYKHHGYWQPMDTYKEAEMLNREWKAGRPRWKTW